MNTNYKERDTILFGCSIDWQGKDTLGGTRHFKELTRKTLATLIDKDFIELDENQNESPTVQEFLDMTAGMDDQITFHGYAVSPTRSDYRVSIEGLTGEGLSTEHLQALIDRLHDADEFDTDIQHGRIHVWYD